MRDKTWVPGCILGLVLMACGPRPTATPNIAPPSPTVPPATVPRLANPTERATPTAGPPPTTVVQTPTPSPLPTARVHLYDDVDELAILTAVFPNLTLSAVAEGYQVQSSPDWTVWVNDRDEGHITQNQRQELVAIIANQVGATPPKEQAPYGPSSDMLAVLETRDGKLVVTHRESILPPVSPLANDVRIERSADVFHDGQDELLITTNTVQTQVIRTEAHLFRWQGGKFVELWNGVEQDDNTAAVNQSEYSSNQATVDFTDVDNDGVDEIVVNGSRTIYPKDSEGRADLTAPSSVSDQRSVNKWNGTEFVLDPTLSTPPAPIVTPTP
jgi:hypothetical protein